MSERYYGGPLVRYGGKVKLAPKIVPMLPRGRLYLEPFFGAGGLFFALPKDVYQVEVINDLDHSIVTFFSALRDQPAELRRLLEATPYSREEYRRCLAYSADPLEEARRVFVRSRQTINGVARCEGNWSRPTSHTSNRVQRSETKLDALETFAARLRGVAIECRDAIAMVLLYAGPGVAMYLDPPYHPSTRRTYGRDAYEHELTAADHTRLLEAVIEAVARGAHVAISGYPCEAYDEALQDWRRVEWQTTANSTTSGPASARTEVLWMSYPSALELRSSGAAPLLDFGASP